MDEQMYMIMARVLSRDASHEEQRQLQAWMDADAVHRQAFEEMSRLWSATDEVLARPAFDAAPAWEKVSSRLHIGSATAAEETPAATRRISLMPTWLRYTVGIAAALVLGVFLFRTLSPDGGMQEVLASAGNREVVLPDQSHVLLREGSSLRYPSSFSSEKREVILKGEAFFEVTKDPQKPFIIDARSVEVQVLGTSFNVRSNDNSASVYVATGKVQVRSAGTADRKVVITPGELAELKGGMLEKRTSEEGNDLFWKTGTMKFVRKPLSAVVAEISRICMVPIKLDENMPSGHKDQLVDISFRKQKMEEMLTELCLISHSKWTKEGDGYLIRAL